MRKGDNTHLIRGNNGEQEALQLLKEKGFQILHHNWRHQRFELDIVALHQKNLVAIEVKTRKNSQNGYPELAVNPKKQQHMLKAISAYRELHSMESYDVRFDIISIIHHGPDAGIQHFEDAFFPNWLNP